VSRTIVRKTSMIGGSALLSLAVGMALPATAGAQGRLTKAPPPTVSSFAASPISAYGFLGGPVTLTAAVTNASTCTLTSNHPLVGLPVTVDCSSGSVSQTRNLPGRTTGRNPYTYHFKLKAVGSRATTAALSVTVAAHNDGCVDIKFLPYQGCNLAGVDLSDVSPTHFFFGDFADANLTYVNFSNDNLSGTSVAGADLSFTNLSGTTLTGIHSGSIVGTPTGLPANWEIVDGYLIGPGANLQGSSLVGANLAGAHLSGANLEGAYLLNATLTDADLSNAQMSEARLDGADLSDSNLSGANLSGDNLDSANLSGANVSGDDLGYAFLTNADLSGADLSGSNLTGADLSGATNLTDTAVAGVIWIGTTCPDGTNSDNDGDTCVNNLTP
jgi:uncharacterized protein YjbI with pentapeptide repeats